MNIKLNNEQINRLQSKSKLYSYLTGSFDHTTFVAGHNKFTFILSGESGVLKTVVDAETSNEDDITFSLDYSKWLTLIQKFSIYSTVNIDVDSSSIRFSTEESSDFGTYNVKPAEFTISTFDDIVKSTMDDSRTLVINDEVMSDFELMNSMFSFQSIGNSIGLKRDSVIYADGSLIIKTNLSNNIDESFFDNLSDGEDTVFVGSDIIKLISYVYKNNFEFVFSSTYEDIYWHDDDTEFVYKGDIKKSELPTDEEFNSFIPSDSDRLVVSAKALKEVLNFFNGVYEGSEWKPLTFKTSTTDGLTVMYESQTTTLSKSVDGVRCNLDSKFILSSDTIKNIVSKINDRLGGDTDINIDYDNSDDSLGVYITSADIYQAILVKLGEI